ncbi:FAD-dependent oxidoreductase [Nocardia panacis]|uniref:FAD-dependent oxidoreductase n=1 Tax=Nocardia panacis TaxID=2340916 RepID=A0A3A4JX33_9NOCA|nr:FAD-binding protein [Nocardia panacis]RJO75149.1 FAD-dependent oxidoreductase [Nocardia panacis]
MKQTLTRTVVIGAGIAGSWLAYRLAQWGVPVVLLTAPHEDTPNVSLGAATVFHRRLVDDPSPEDIAAAFADETATQHPELRPLLTDHLASEFAELSELVPFQTLETMVIPRHPVPFPRLGAGGVVISVLHDQIRAYGGTIMCGRVTDLLVEDGICRGVAYSADGQPGIVQAGATVLASGGYSGLMRHAPTPNSGSMLGIFAAAGGALTNLEFSQRHALGDRSAGRVLYPPDLAGAQFYRDGQRAVWLERAYHTLPEERRDLDIFQQYWRHNGHIPHELRRGETRHEIGPVYGLSMGGAAHTGGATNLAGVYALGEARHDIAANSILGRPWATYLSSAGLLADTLRELPDQQMPETFSVPARSVEVSAELRREVRERLHAFEDHRFSEGAVQAFVQWCRTTRRSLPAEFNGSAGVLILAESYALSALSRRESRGYFYRADFPTADPALSGLRTVARYDSSADEVSVELVANIAGTKVPVEVGSAR